MKPRITINLDEYNELKEKINKLQKTINAFSDGNSIHTKEMRGILSYYYERIISKDDDVKNLAIEIASKNKEIEDIKRLTYFKFLKWKKT